MIQVYICVAFKVSNKCIAVFLQDWTVDNVLINKYAKCTLSLSLFQLACHDWHAVIFVDIDEGNKCRGGKKSFDESITFHIQRQTKIYKSLQTRCYLLKINYDQSF